jgi:hypothetical protein
MKAILTDAVATGNATARAISFHNRDPRSILYPNSQWRTSFIGDDYLWLGGDGLAGRDLDARTSFFYVATVNTPSMAAKSVGSGSQYAIASADKMGAPLMVLRTTGSTFLPMCRQMISGQWLFMTPRPVLNCRPLNHSRVKITNETS